MQEAINNAIKHANAEEISVSFKETNEQYLLTIEDNGIGFETATVSDGNGLENMKLRAEEIYGKLHFLSKENHGTTVQLTIDKMVADRI